MSDQAKASQKTRFAELTAELESLNKEAEKLKETRIRIMAEVERAGAEKKSLEAALVAEYGTCDIAELKKMLDDMERANEAAVANYRESVERSRMEIGEMTKALAAMGIRV